MKLKRSFAAVAVLLAFAFASCSTVKGLFGGGSDEHATGDSKHVEEDLSEVLKL